MAKHQNWKSTPVPRGFYDRRPLRRPYTKIADFFFKTYPKTENRKPIIFSKQVFERFLKSEVLVFFPTRVWEGNQNPKPQKWKTDGKPMFWKFLGLVSESDFVAHCATVRLCDRTVRPCCRTVAQSHKSRTFYQFEDFPGRFTSSNFQEYSMC